MKFTIDSGRSAMRQRTEPLDAGCARFLSPGEAAVLRAKFPQGATGLQRFESSAFRDDGDQVTQISGPPVPHFEIVRTGATIAVPKAKQIFVSGYLSVLETLPPLPLDVTLTVTPPLPPEEPIMSIALEAQTQDGRAVATFHEPGFRDGRNDLTMAVVESTLTSTVAGHDMLLYVLLGKDPAWSRA